MLWYLGTVGIYATILATVVYMIVQYTPACFSTFYQSTIVRILVENP